MHVYNLAVSEVVDNVTVVDAMAISEVVDAMAFDEGDDDEAVADAMGVDGVVDDGEVEDEAVDDAMVVDEVVDYAKVVDEMVDDATGVDGAVDDGEVVDEAVDDAMVVYDVVDDVMVAYDEVDDEEVVDETLQLDVNTVVELHFHVLLLGIQSTENKRKCQKNIPGHCKFPHGTNKPISNLIVLRDNHHFSIQVYTAKYLPKNISKGNGMAVWPRSRYVNPCQSRGPGFYSRSWDLLDLFSVVSSSNPWPLVASCQLGF